MQSRVFHAVIRRPRWGLGVIAVATAAIVASLLPPSEGAPTPPASVSAATEADSLGFAVQLGPEQRIMGPTGEGDNPYFSERRGGKLYGYFGTSRTREWHSRNNTRLTNARIILDRGQVGKFDECGAWLQGSFQKLTRQHWIAFYHAEGKGPGADDCDHYANTTVWRMAMAETTDGGRTWRRPNYPNNVVLTGTGASSTGGITNAGTGRTVKVGSYYYMFFKTAHGTQPGEPGLHIARSAVSSGGRPGTWKKYYCTNPPLGGEPVCGFTENGVGGKSSAIGGVSSKARYVAWNSALNRWLAFDASGQNGFRMFASPVGVGADAEQRMKTALVDSDGNPNRWHGSEDIYPLVSTATDPYVDQWGGHIRDGRSKQLYAYPSIGGSEGQSCCTGGSFYVYYVKLFPGDKFTDRYLFRRKVTIIASETALNRVELTTYRNSKGQRRSSTEAPKEKAFRRLAATGYLLSHPATGWKQVFDCSRKGDHALFTNKCKTGWKPVRRVGFVHPKKTGTARVPVYRCVAKRKHYASNSRTCDGGKREARIGFALRSL
jgi:hypothetical protein